MAGAIKTIQKRFRLPFSEFNFVAAQNNALSNIEFVVSVLMVDNLRHFLICYRIHKLQGNGRCNKDYTKSISPTILRI